jgi:hypothetical protein
MMQRVAPKSVASGKNAKRKKRAQADEDSENENMQSPSPSSKQKKDKGQCNALNVLSISPSAITLELRTPPFRSEYRIMYTQNFAS